MIPLGDVSRRPLRFPAVTLALILANGFVFFLELAGGEAFVSTWAMVPADIVGGRHWITMLTATFLHGSWSHILGNMLFLWVFGPEIEDAMNPGRYLIFYLAGGVAANLAQIALAPASTVPTLGASGAIAAVMGAFLITYPRDRIRTVLLIGFFFTVTFVPAFLLIGLWFLLQLISVGAVTTAQAGGGGGVAYAAHVGGVIFGALTARLFEDARRIGE
ncbi:MAG TPA: rhomboid family intramembrane serine protease [bacterium]|nr:rhomboid family intramembrane serine protease [bacterium]